jgi:hypothetical protein
MKMQANCRHLRDARLMVAIADAHAAADAAGRISSEAGAWVSRMGAGGDDAGDAAACAMRARMAAERAEHCSTTAEAWSCARLAWAIVASTREASERVNAAIAESLIVASATEWGLLP